MAASQQKRKCSRCGETKPLAEFPTSGTNASGTTRYRYCKPCHSDYQRAGRLKALFNLTPDEYDQIAQHQGGACFICGRLPKKQRLNVDHDHKSGLVRGLLCFSCNLALGRFRDDLSRLERAVEYLKHPPAVQALGEERLGRVGRVTRRRGSEVGKEQRQQRRRKK